MAPGHCSNRTLCELGNSDTEPYQCGHSTLLAHAYTAELYHTTYQPHQNGTISMAINSDWVEPLNPKSSYDIASANFFIEAWLGWFADPIYRGDYPEIMRQSFGDRFQFTAEQKTLLLKSNDFYGLNSYTTKWATVNIKGEFVTQQKDAAGKPIGPAAQSSWLFNGT
jgi:beta-glucosidase